MSEQGGRCCGPLGCCGPSLSLIATIFILASIAAPWYLDLELITNPHDEVLSAKAVMRSWDISYCAVTREQGLPPMQFCELGSSYKWRKEECKTGVNDCSQLRNIYTVAPVFMGIAVLSSLLVTITLFRRCCGSNPVPGKSLFGIFFAASGLVGLLVAVLTFALRHAEAVHARDGGCPGFGSCDTFWGFHKIASTGGGGSSALVWAPIGWGVAVLGLLMHVFASCCVARTVPHSQYRHAQYDFQEPMVGAAPVYYVQPGPGQQTRPVHSGAYAVHLEYQT